MKRSLMKIWLISLLVFMVSLYFSPVCLASQVKGRQIPELGEEGCTAFGVTGVGTYDGFALIGGTSDNNWMMRASLVYRVPEKGYRYLCAEVPLKGMIRAMNEKGFCFSRNAISPDKKWRGKLGVEGGIKNYELTVKFATECATVDDAIRLLETTARHPSLWKSFIFADATGKCVLVQLNPEDVEVMEPDKYGWVSVSNHLIGPKLEKYQTVEVGSSSWYRYNRSLELRKGVREEKADPYMLMNFLADTKNMDVEKDMFKSICSHGKNGGSIFAFVMQPALKIFWYCYGPADGKVMWHEGTWGHFVPFAIPQLKPGQYVTEDGIVSPEFPLPYAREHLRLRPLSIFPMK